MSTARVRQVPGVHRLAIGCPCGETLTLPDAGYSYQTCACGRTYEHTYQPGRSPDSRRLGIHESHAWRRIRREQHDG